MRQIGLVFALFLALAGAAALWLTNHQGVHAGFVDARVNTTLLRVNLAYARDGEIAGGEQSQLDLAARFPDFRPLSLEKPRLDNEMAVFLRLSPQDISLDPGERVARLYARFLEKDAWSHPGGLQARRFEKGSPFEREELYIAPPEGRLFAARCMRPAQPPDGLPNTCITEIRMRGLDVQVRFAPELLPDWEQLMAGARGLVESMARQAGDADR